MLLSCALLLALQAASPATQDSEQGKTEVAVQGDIVWYGTWQQGLAEAKRSGRAILLQSAAPQCRSVPGIW